MKIELHKQSEFLVISAIYNTILNQQNVEVAQSSHTQSAPVGRLTSARAYSRTYTEVAYRARHRSRTSFVTFNKLESAIIAKPVSRLSCTRNR